MVTYHLMLGEAFFLEKKFLTEGLMKSIGNGHYTRVWCDKWVFDEVPRKPINVQSKMDLNLKVESLLNSIGSWCIEIESSNSGCGCCPHFVDSTEF